ncbi:MAG: hypothetical protein KDM81_10235, partial [Verrucomicrobiae bacterium]|nr:hypothetical protein [Verrucomicrobiae bacterium]
RTASRLYCISGGARAKDVAHAGSTDVQPAQPSDIWAATREGNRNALIHDLDEGASGNARDPQEGSTPLNTAVLFGQTEIVKLLLDRVSLSPGETRVCFEYQRGYEYKDAGRTLYLADFDAKKPSITNARAFANAEGANRWFAYPRWTKDEAAIVYHASPSLYLYTLKDGTTRKVSTNPRAEYRYPHTAGAPK